MQKGLSINSLYVGKKYSLSNWGENCSFEIEHTLPNNDFLVKDLYTLERYRLNALIQFGKGKDFEIIEIIENS